jgi:hypothetical protein
VRASRQADGLPLRQAVRLYRIPEVVACMTRGKRLECPRIVVVQAAELKFATVDEAWAAVRPVLARATTAAILRAHRRREPSPDHRRHAQQPSSRTSWQRVFTSAGNLKLDADLAEAHIASGASS